MTELGSLLLGIFRAIVDRFVAFQQSRRKVRALVHRAYFVGEVGASALTTPPSLQASVPVTGSSEAAWGTPYYFMKVTNLSQNREIWIEHVWLEGDPRVNVVMPERPLPARLRPDETWEGWRSTAELSHIANVERAGRVRLSNGKTVKSRPNKGVPPFGYVAGPGGH
jgi:hypothetical protein